MNRKLMTDELSKRLGIKKTVASAAVNAILNTIVESLEKGEKVTLVGFGTLDVIKKKSRNGVNPRTLEKMVIDEKMAVRFKAGKALKKLINGEIKSISEDTELGTETSSEVVSA